MTRGSAAREALTLSGPAGPIEALLEAPAGAFQHAVAVICHPHPLHQGTMLNKVVHTIARAMNDLAIPAVRFNFRGVGASEGTHGDGHGEVGDVTAVAGWACERYPDADLWLAGFSFGAAVAIRSSTALAASQLISIAPPVTRMAGFLAGVRPSCPWLIVQGEEDEVVACADVRDWASAHEPRPDLVLLPEVDHFFHGRLTLLRETLTTRLTGRLPASGPT